MSISLAESHDYVKRIHFYVNFDREPWASDLILEPPLTLADREGDRAEFVAG
jgi:hypothetical protein